MPMWCAAVTVAVVGLIGVIVGTLLGGVASDIVERRKRRAAGRAAARVIAAELDIVANKLNSAAAPAEQSRTTARVDAGGTTPVEEPGWWIGVPPTRAWEAHFDALASICPAELLKEVAAAYAQIESWKVERDNSTTDPTQSAIRRIEERCRCGRGGTD